MRYDGLVSNDHAMTRPIERIRIGNLCRSEIKNVFGWLKRERTACIDLEPQFFENFSEQKREEFGASFR